MPRAAMWNRPRAGRVAVALLAGTAGVLYLGCSFIPVARSPSFSPASGAGAATLKPGAVGLLLSMAPPAHAADLGGVAESLWTPLAGSVPPLGLLLLLSLAATWAELRPRPPQSASSSHAADGSDNRFELRRQTLVSLGLASSASAAPAVVFAETPEEKKLRVEEEKKAKEEEKKAKKEQADAERKAKKEKEEAERKAKKEKEEQEAKAKKEKAAEAKKEKEESERKAKERKEQEEKAKREAAEAEAKKKQQQQSGGGFNPLETVGQLFLGTLVAATFVPSKKE